MTTARIAGIGTLPNGTYEAAERDMAATVLEEALGDADLGPGDLDGLYMPKPRPWTPQGFFSTFLTHWLGMELDRALEVYTGGTSGGTAFRSAVADVRSGAVDTAAVLAVERNSIIETDAYFEYILGIFDRQFQSPIGPSIPGVYAQSLRRYRHEYGVDREAIAAIVEKNRRNAADNPEALFGGSSVPDVEEILDSRPIADPLRLYECPAPTDGAAAVIVTGDDAVDADVEVTGVGYDHPSSHLLGTRRRSLAEMPAVAGATDEALADADLAAAELDVLEPYAPFPHVEAIVTEELGLFERGDGARAAAAGGTAVGGEVPVSPSGGCIGRGHPAMVTPLLNHAEAVRQLTGTAANPVDGARAALTTSEHGHVDGMNAAVFEVRE
jgi:acetyl-CoA acetyltransferase